MKKFLTLIMFGFFVLTGSSVYADDLDLPATGDLWDNWNTREEGRELKPVTDEEFDKAIDQVDKKVNKRKYRQQKRNIPKGEEFSQSNETELINIEHGDKNSLPVISLPVHIIVGEDYVPVGHYQVNCEKLEDGSVVLKLYQAHDLLAQFPAIETTEDFDEDTISFAKWFFEGDDKIKIIFGSLDFNAYTVVNVTNP